MKRKLLAMWLVISMVISMVPVTGISSQVKAAEADGIRSGATYVMKSAWNQDLLLMPKNSRPGWTYVCLFERTGSDSQKWKVDYNGNNYVIKNAGTAYTLHYGESVKDAHVDQNGYDGTDFYKWNLVKVNSEHMQADIV